MNMEPIMVLPTSPEQKQVVVAFLDALKIKYLIVENEPALLTMYDKSEIENVGDDFLKDLVKRYRG